MLKRLFVNPISTKELQKRMRNGRTFTLITIYLGLIGLVVGFLYYYQTTNNYYSGYKPLVRSELGKNLFYAVILIELVLINFIAPGLTASSITSERERKTFDLIKTTLITPQELIIGKFTSAIVYILMLIFTTLPIQVIVSSIGGIGGSQITIATIILIVTGAFFCALGVFLSSGFKKTTPATVTAYLSIFFPVILIAVFYLFINNGPPNTFNNPEYEAYWVYGIWIVIYTNPFIAAFVTELLFNELQSLFIIQVPPLSASRGYTLISPWILFTIFYVIMTISLLIASARLVAKVDKL